MSPHLFFLLALTASSHVVFSSATVQVCDHLPPSLLLSPFPTTFLSFHRPSHLQALSITGKHGLNELTKPRISLSGSMPGDQILSSFCVILCCCVHDNLTGLSFVPMAAQPNTLDGHINSYCVRFHRAIKIPLPAALHDPTTPGMMCGGGGQSVWDTPMLPTTIKLRMHVFCYAQYRPYKHNM